MKLEVEIKKIPVDAKLISDYKDGSHMIGFLKRQHEKEIFTAFLARSKYKLINPFELVIDDLMERVYFEFIHVDIPWQITSIDPKKHAKGRSPKERYERRTGDFIKNTLPTLPAVDRKHFEKKFKLPSTTKPRKKK
jgi:hypothetical protein